MAQRQLNTSSSPLSVFSGFCPLGGHLNHLLLSAFSREPSISIRQCFHLSDGLAETVMSKTSPLSCFVILHKQRSSTFQSRSLSNISCTHVSQRPTTLGTRLTKTATRLPDQSHLISRCVSQLVDSSAELGYFGYSSDSITFGRLLTFGTLSQADRSTLPAEGYIDHSRRGILALSWNE